MQIIIYLVTYFKNITALLIRDKRLLFNAQSFLNYGMHTSTGMSALQYWYGNLTIE